MSKSIKKGLHPRNPHRRRYDFKALVESFPPLGPFVSQNKFGDFSIDFSDPKAVLTLNKAILKHFYQVENWDIPQGNLCPPIPGRADYIHHLSDLLRESNGGEIPEGDSIHGLDIGAGANCVYPLIGSSVYQWNFVAADIDPKSIKAINKILESNKSLFKKIEVRRQKNPDNIFTDMIKENDRFDFSMCNPPFHSSLEEAIAGNVRKVENLKAKAQQRGTLSEEKVLTKEEMVLNFGGQKAELWCPGGEAAFIKRMIKQSVAKKENCLWFTTLVSKRDNLTAIYDVLKNVKVASKKTIVMEQGQKTTRIVAWTFKDQDQQKAWFQ